MTDLTVTGNLLVSGTNNLNPFWVAGKVDGASLAIRSTKGRNTFSVARASGHAVGVYEITFPAHPDGIHYVISMMTENVHNFIRLSLRHI